MKTRIPILLLFIVAAASSSAAVPESTYSDLKWRLLGPFRGGWALVGAGVPGEPAVFYFGSADGGVWRTRDAGVTWKPLERAGSASVGALAIAPSDPKTIWVGTGQVHQRWDVVSGDGVYRSTDGGDTWAHAGLEKTRHIGQIWVDPRDAKVALVAALGHMFGPNEERGVFRTEDGGATWKRTLFKDADTGAVHLAADPAVPDVVYASLWEVRRKPWLDYFEPAAGPRTGLYKSTDAGRTWAPAGTAGWPSGDKGRISLAVAPGTSARRVWAAVDGPVAKGLFRSDDGGATWVLVSDEDEIVSSYMSFLTPDPRNPDILWSVGRSLRRSTDGGRTFTITKGSPGGDDYHHLWIDPTDARRMITSADQGCVVTLNGGASWSSWYNQPTGQLYRLAADERFPYRLYAGQQDNGTVSIASRSDYGQLTFRDWNPVGGDERDADIPDPEDPDIVYGAGLGGRLSKWNAKTGEVRNVSPWPVASYGNRPGTSRYRYAWITPIAVSGRPRHAIYVGAQVLFRSTDKGESWEVISPDLTGAAPAATTGAAGKPACDGSVPVERATQCGFGVIFTITPSSAANGLVWVGTDNGRVQVTKDGGKSWKNVTPPAMADWTKVNTIDPSPDDPATAYVAADRHRLDDFRPIAFRTHDGGATWTEIGHGLPADGWLGVVRHDPKRKGLLYAGTNRGVYVSFDDGDTWQSLKLNLPQTGINDLLVKGDDVVVASQGRAIWALDNVQPLRHAAEAAATRGAFLVTPATTVRLRANASKDTPLPPEEPRGENPPVGAVLDYVLPSAAGGPVSIEIADAAGHVIRRFASDATPEKRPAKPYFSDLWLGDPPRPAARPGHNRFVWDLRLAPPRTLEAEYTIAGVPGKPTPINPAGAFVLPGRYEVRLTASGGTVHVPLTITMDPRSKSTPADLEALFAFQREVEASVAKAVELAGAVEAEEKRLKAAKSKKTDQKLAAIGKLSPSPWDAPAAIASALTALVIDLEAGDAPPTEPQKRVLAESREALARYEGGWKTLK